MQPVEPDSTPHVDAYWRELMDPEWGESDLAFATDEPPVGRVARSRARMTPIPFVSAAACLLIFAGWFLSQQLRSETADANAVKPGLLDASKRTAHAVVHRSGG